VNLLPVHWFSIMTLLTLRLTTLNTEGIFMHIILHIRRCALRTTLNIDDELLEEAVRLTGISEKTSLVRFGLQTLIAVESAKRLAKLGGTEKKLKSIPRRRS